MEERTVKSLNVLLSLTLVSLLVCIAVFLYDIVYINHTPYPAAQSIPASAVDVRIQNLERNLDYLQRDLVFRLDQKLYYFGMIALVISAVAAFFGWRTFKDLDTLIREKVQGSLDKALYQLDATNLRIWIISYPKALELTGDFLYDENHKQIFENNKPKKEIIKTNLLVEMKKVYDRIELSGLKNSKTIKKLGASCYDGVTVVPVFDQVMEEDFRKFITDNKNQLNPRQAAFVLYTRDYIVSQTNTLDSYTNLATANMLPTVASMLLTVGRGLSDVRIIDKKHEYKEGS